jgi:hypothetical protein
MNLSIGFPTIGVFLFTANASKTCRIAYPVQLERKSSGRNSIG